MYAVEPGTPEGQLVRTARKRKRLTLREAASRLGISKEKLGYIERGYDSSRKPYKYEDADLARIAAEFGIPAEELDRISRGEAAVMLRGFPAEPPAPSPPLGAGDLAALDRLFAALIRDRPVHDRRVLEFLWRGKDGEGNLKSLAERVRDVIDWIDGTPPGSGAATVRETG